MLNLCLFLAVALIMSATVRGAETLPASLTDFSRIGNDQKQESFSADFSSGLRGWTMTSPGEFSLERHGGRNQSPGLKISRKNPADYNIIGHSIKLIPGESYELSFYVKTAGIQGAGIRAGVEFYALKADGTQEYLFPTTYTQGISGSCDWTKIVLKIPRVPARTEKAGIAFFLDKKSYGTAWIDDIEFRSATPSLVAIMIQPHGHRVRSEAPVTLRSVRENGEFFYDSAGREAHMQFNDDPGEGQFIPITNSEASFNLPNLPDGKHKLTCRIVDRHNKQIQDAMSLPLLVGSRPSVFAFSPTGVLVVNGKKFMPLGFYITGLTERTIRLVKEAGGNVVMPYGSLWIGKVRTGIRRKLDELAKSNLKIIFSLKDVYAGINHGITEYDGLPGDDEIVAGLVAALKDHPALLAWYVNDELTFSPMLVRRRDLLAELDPDHPLWTVQYQTTELPVYARIADVIGLSLYSVSNLPPEKSYIGNDAGIRQGTKTSVPFWAVPQIHNLGIYDASRKCRSPEAQEIRTMALLQAGIGAKGFVFYMLDDLWHPNAPADNFDKVWPHVVSVFRDLRSLEPFITSDEPPEEINIAGDEGRVRVFRLRNNGDERIIITALGPGKSQATITVGSKRFRSLHNRCVSSDGKIVFQGTGIDSDVLIPE